MIDAEDMLAVEREKRLHAEAIENVRSWLMRLDAVTLFKIGAAFDILIRDTLPHDAPIDYLNSKNHWDLCLAIATQIVSHRNNVNDDATRAR